MKKYLIYSSILLVITLVGLLIFKIYKNRQIQNPATQGQIEELHKKIGELEDNKREQSIVIESLINQVSQIEDEQIKKLEDTTSELQTSIKNSNTKQLESRISAVEKNIDTLNTFTAKNSTVDSYLFGKAMDSIRN